jgi:GT2 family glycosyltransferase
MDVSIVIVSFNARTHLERCLDSLQTTPPQVSHEIVVVDNASEDGSVQAAARYPGVSVVALDSNKGFATATNVGILRSRGRNVLLLNSDTIIPPGAIDLLVATLERHAQVAIVGPRLVDSAGRPELSFGAMISPVAEWRQRRLMKRLSRGDEAAWRWLERMTRQEHYPDWVSAACLLVRRSDAEAVGLLDERFFLYTEDVDFCASVRALGRRVLFAPQVQVVHVRGASVASARTATYAAYRRSQLAFYQKHHPWVAPFLRVYHWVGR